MARRTSSAAWDLVVDGDDPRRREPLRVVLAEDDLEVRLFLAQALRKDGHTVIEIENGTQLLEFLRAVSQGALEESPPDVIVSDIRMPGKSGLDVLASMREVGWRTPFVLTTAFGDAATHARARAAGAFAVFDKPFDVDDLRTVVLNAGRRPGAVGSTSG
ncbi:response regulator [Polyangium mundeleinium]|uniref:Response regulator n=1 Tax=Polyangium mundeleinium TaxID=2995306 RepID=A0ABT5EZS5_9BACT|nr:response regulator [Polyangium mundeleinium]MDC0746767.1 response regulator [Polyangium mundeleinium]